MHVALVLLPEAADPDPAAITVAFAELWPDAHPIFPAVSTEPATPEEASFVSEDGVAHVVLIPAPLADDVAERGTGHSLAYLAQDPDLPPHDAHLLVVWSPSDALTLVEGFVAQARLVAAIAVASDAIAVHVPAAGATHPAEYYVEVTREVPEPIMLWTGVSHAFTDERRHSFLSFGMQQFGLPDLLLSCPEDQGSAAIEAFFGLLSQCATSGNDLPDGLTIGLAPGQESPISHEPNPVDPELTVMRIDL